MMAQASTHRLAWNLMMNLPAYSPAIKQAMVSTVEGIPTSLELQLRACMVMGISGLRAP